MCKFGFPNDFVFVSLGHIMRACVCVFMGFQIRGCFVLWFFNVWVCECVDFLMFLFLYKCVFQCCFVCSVVSSICGLVCVVDYVMCLSVYVGFEMCGSVCVVVYEICVWVCVLCNLLVFI